MSLGVCLTLRVCLASSGSIFGADFKTKPVEEPKTTNLSLRICLTSFISNLTSTSALELEKQKHGFKPGVWRAPVALFWRSGAAWRGARSGAALEKMLALGAGAGALNFMVRQRARLRKN